jgi:hypothetical protein
VPLDALPTSLVVPTRDDVGDRWIADALSRVPDADGGASSQLYVESRNFADQQMPLYDAAVKATAAGQIQNAVGGDLDKWGIRLGGTSPSNPYARRGVTPSSGFIVVSTVAGGANVNVGTELKDPKTGLKFTSTITAVYQDQSTLPLVSSAGGPASNLPAGTQLQFTTPPPGVGQFCTIFADAAGDGLTGGAPAEGDDDYRARLLAGIQEPPAAGNEAQIVQAMSAITTIAILAAFCWPTVYGPGTYAAGFLIPPSTLGGSRLPNMAQQAQMLAILQSAFPSDDGIVMASGAEQATRVRLLVTWPDTAVGWADAVPWPPNYATPVTVTAATVSTATVGSASLAVAPAAGQTIGFYDPVTRTFRMKRILSVSGGPTSYGLIFDMSTLNASDPSYVPIVGQLVSPWSDSLNQLVNPLLSYIDKQGPGEMYASFSDPGRRQRRFPAPEPAYFPSRIENRVLDGFEPFVEDSALYEPTAPYSTSVGVPGTLYYVHRLSDFGAFVQ